MYFYDNFEFIRASISKLAVISSVVNLFVVFRNIRGRTNLKRWCSDEDVIESPNLRDKTVATLNDWLACTQLKTKSTAKPPKSTTKSPPKPTTVGIKKVIAPPAQKDKVDG